MTHSHYPNHKLINTFLLYSQREIIDLYAALQGAIRIPVPDELDAVYVPGTRDDRVLIVAHYDTVWSDKDPDFRIKHPARYGPVFHSRDPKVGIGGDDRAGCAALWMLRKLGHSLLLVPGEERGCRGSGHIARNIPEGMKQHAYAIQFDRRGARDLAHYGHRNDAFDTYIKTAFPSYTVTRGSCTDIARLCPALGICGINPSIGFYGEHSPHETLDLYDFNRTVAHAHHLLSQKCPTHSFTYPVNHYDSDGMYGHWLREGDRWFQSGYGNGSTGTAASEGVGGVGSSSKSFTVTDRSRDFSYVLDSIDDIISFELAGNKGVRIFAADPGQSDSICTRCCRAWYFKYLIMDSMGSLTCPHCYRTTSKTNTLHREVMDAAQRQQFINHLWSGRTTLTKEPTKEADLAPAPHTLKATRKHSKPRPAAPTNTGPLAVIPLVAEAEALNAHPASSPFAANFRRGSEMFHIFHTDYTSKPWFGDTEDWTCYCHKCNLFFFISTNPTRIYHGLPASINDHRSPDTVRGMPCPCCRSSFLAYNPHLDDKQFGDMLLHDYTCQCCKREYLSVFISNSICFNCNTTNKTPTTFGDNFFDRGTVENHYLIEAEVNANAESLDDDEEEDMQEVINTLVHLDGSDDPSLHIG